MSSAYRKPDTRWQHATALTGDKTYRMRATDRRNRHAGSVPPGSGRHRSYCCSLRPRAVGAPRPRRRVRRRSIPGSRQPRMTCLCSFRSERCLFAVGNVVRWARTTVLSLTVRRSSITVISWRCYFVSSPPRRPVPGCTRCLVMTGSFSSSSAGWCSAREPGGTSSARWSLEHGSEEESARWVAIKKMSRARSRSTSGAPMP